MNTKIKPEAPLDVAKTEEAVTSVLVENIREKTNMFYDALVTKAEKSRLPEDIFKGYFLPYFSGQMPINKETTVISDWIGVAGTPMSEVEIIDTQTGQPLFTVPALFDSNIIERVKREPGQSLSDIYSQYELRNAGIPAVANNYLSNALNDKLSKIGKASDSQPIDNSRWTAILSRYGISSEPAAAETKVVAGPNDDVEYD